MKDSIADECDAGFFNTTKLVMGPAADTEVWSDCLDFEVQRFRLRPRSAAKSGLVPAREACSWNPGTIRSTSVLCNRCDHAASTDRSLDR